VTSDIAEGARKPADGAFLPSALLGQLGVQTGNYWRACNDTLTYTDDNSFITRYEDHGDIDSTEPLTLQMR